MFLYRFNTWTLQLFRGISEFYVTGEWTEAGFWAISQALVASNNSRWPYFFNLIWLPMFSGLSKSQHPKGTFGSHQDLWFSAIKSRTVLQYVSPPYVVYSCDDTNLTLWWGHMSNVIQRPLFPIFSYHFTFSDGYRFKQIYSRACGCNQMSYVTTITSASMFVSI